MQNTAPELCCLATEMLPGNSKFSADDLALLCYICTGHGWNALHFYTGTSRKNIAYKQNCYESLSTACTIYNNV